MNYRSIADMNDTIMRNLPRLPRDIDLVVGVPRSGLLAGNLLCLALNIALTDVEGFLEGRVLAAGKTRRTARLDRDPAALKRVLVIDDSVYRGHAMTEVRRRIEAAAPEAEITYCAVYGNETSHPSVDIVLEAVPQPRMFQWNVFHHGSLEHCCVDIDGVLCCDPTHEENDDGERYLRFLAETAPMLTPSKPIGWLVTSRLEKYRAQTEDWLEKAGIAYRELIMLDLPSAEARRKARAHGSFKGEVYRRLDALLFIESELEQAEEIAQLSGKPVLCIETHHVVTPEPSLLAIGQKLRSLPRRRRVAESLPVLNLAARSLLGERAYGGLRALVKGRAGG